MNSNGIFFFLRSFEQGHQLILEITGKNTLNLSRIVGEICGAGPQHPQPERIRSTLEARHKDPLGLGLEQREMKIVYVLYS